MTAELAKGRTAGKDNTELFFGEAEVGGGNCTPLGTFVLREDLDVGYMLELLTGYVSGFHRRIPSCCSAYTQSCGYETKGEDCVQNAFCALPHLYSPEQE